MVEQDERLGFHQMEDRPGVADDRSHPLPLAFLLQRPGNVLSLEFLKQRETMAPHEIDQGGTNHFILVPEPPVMDQIIDFRHKGVRQAQLE
jgi:hypothetical protein